MHLKFLLLLFSISCLVGSSNDRKIQSPDGNVSANLVLTESGELRYSVEYIDQVIVEPSRLGITVEGIDLEYCIFNGCVIVPSENAQHVDGDYHAEIVKVNLSVPQVSLEALNQIAEGKFGGCTSAIPFKVSNRFFKPSDNYNLALPLG